MAYLILDLGGRANRVMIICLHLTDPNIIAQPSLRSLMHKLLAYWRKLLRFNPVGG